VGTSRGASTSPATDESVRRATAADSMAYCSVQASMSQKRSGRRWLRSTSRPMNFSESPSACSWSDTEAR
jgi:hypothetical protein